MINNRVDSSSSADHKKEPILFIDDHNNDAHQSLSVILTQQGYEVRFTADKSVDLSVVNTDSVKLILLALNPPEMNGYEICQLLKAQEKTQDIPVIFLSTSDDPLDKVKAFEIGASDYISQPIVSEEILVKVKTYFQIREISIRLNKIKEQFEQSLQQHTKELEITNQKLKQEISQRKQAQDRLLKLALNDSVTGLPSRNSCLSSLKQALQNLKEKPDEQFAVLLVNCARFEEMKCYLGHLASNQLIIEFARRLGSSVADANFLGRFDSNEFIIIFKNFQAQQEVIDYAENIQEQFKYPLTIFSPIPEVDMALQEIVVSCKIGIVIGNSNYQTEHDLLQDAEIAAYQASKSTEDSYHLFQSSISSKSYTVEQKQAHLQAKKILKEAFKRQEFLVYYQPIFCLKTDNIVGFEALLRWKKADNQLILPQDFLPTAENSDLTIPLGDLVLHEACSQIKILQEQHESQKDFFITINLSNKQLIQPKLKNKIAIVLQKYQLSSKYLNFDISESVLIHKQPSTTKLLKELQNASITLNIDDFASNSETLKQFQDSSCSNLKIDYSLIKKLDSEKDNQAIKTTIKNLIHLAHQMNMTVTAEGIETEDQLNFLKSSGCDYGQGFFFAKPLAKESLEAFLLWRI